MREDLQKAFQILGVEPGASRDAIMRRYKRMALVWHPDRMNSEESRKDAEEELKKINNAKDVLIKHLDTEHKETGCECQGSAQKADEGGGRRAGPGPSPGPGPGPSRTHDEEEAMRRDAERRRRAAEEEAARRDEERRRQAAQDDNTNKGAANYKYEDAQKQESGRQDADLRWKIALAEAAVLVLLCIFGWSGTGIKSWWHDLTWKQDADRHAQEEKDKVVLDACQQAAANSPSSTPPSFATANIKQSMLGAVRVWRCNCKGMDRGAILTGEDQRGQPMNALYYGPNLTFQCQMLISYESPNSVSVELWNAPEVFAGRTVYQYDPSGNVIQVRRLNAMSQPEVTLTVERRTGGRLYDLKMDFADGRGTRQIYDSSGYEAELDKEFYYFSVFALNKIPKQIDTANNLISPDSLPTTTTSTTPTLAPLQPGGDTMVDRFRNKSPFALPSDGLNLPSLNQLPSTSASTSTYSTSGHLYSSPFGNTTTSTSTSATDQLLNKLESQQK